MHRSLLSLLSLSPFVLAIACGDDTTSTGGGGSGAGGSGASSQGGTNEGGTPTQGGGGETSTGGAGGVGGSGGSSEGGAGAFELTSTAYSEGEMIPVQYVCPDGGGNDNTSPPLAWTSGPPGTMSYAMVMRDLDFGGFLHWVIWDIPANVHETPEGIEHAFAPADPLGAKQAPFTQGLIGYFGPCSPNSVNTYEITLYAIDVATIPGLDATSTKDEAEAAIVDAAIAETTLSGES